MSSTRVVLSCTGCHRESVIATEDLRPDIACPGCKTPLPEVGVVVLPDDEALDTLVNSSRTPVFVAFHADSALPTEDMKLLVRAAGELSHRAVIAIAAADTAPLAVKNVGIRLFPTYLFSVDGTITAKIEGETHSEDAWLFMLDAVNRFSMPPLRQRPSPCLRCGGRVLVRCLPVEHGVQPGSNLQVHLERLAATHVAQPRQTVSWANVTSTVSTQDPSVKAGELEAFVCRACGHVEWMASEPNQIPIGPAHRTQLINLSDDNPYR